jgi:hypothetical protein
MGTKDYFLYKQSIIRYSGECMVQDVADFAYGGIGIGNISTVKLFVPNKLMTKLVGKSAGTSG